MKSPPKQYRDDEARELVEQFIVVDDQVNPNGYGKPSKTEKGS